MHGETVKFTRHIIFINDSNIAVPKFNFCSTL